MPLLWRYLLSHYLKVFILCALAFIAILLTMRLDEIAYFATLGPQAAHIVWFALQQIPYVLPIVLPIAALISAILLVQNLSQSSELTSMRSCGFALRDILAPVVIASLFLSALNFYIVSEQSTTSHLNAGLLKNHLRSINPLLLLHNKHVMRMKGFYFDTLGPSRVGEFAQDVLLFTPHKHSGRLNMLTAKQLQASITAFNGDHVTLLTSRQASAENEPEHLMMENMEKTMTTIQDFAQMLEKKIWTVNNDHLRLPLLLVRLDEARTLLSAKRSASASPLEIKQAKHAMNCCITEMMRRISVGMAVFSFTLMGLAFGISISRSRSNRGILYVIGLGSFYLIAFFIAKNFEQALIASTLLYLLPHAFIFICSLWMLRRIAHGIE